MFNYLPQPAIIAHRGASAHAPENTLAAFELALRQGADVIELDAKLTSDGHVVVFHDQTVDRITTAHGRIKDMTLANLRKLDAGSHFDISFRGEVIPTLEEVFKAVGQLTFINIELTNYASPTDNLSDKVVDLVKRHKLVSRVMFSSFNPFTLLQVHRLLPEAPIGLLTFSGIRGFLLRSWLGRVFPYQALHPEYHDVTHKLISNTHRRGRKVFTYTVNQEDDMRGLFEIGVDGIFTDDPLLARQILAVVNRTTSL